jgi:hypothetical protein
MSFKNAVYALEYYSIDNGEWLMACPGGYPTESEALKNLKEKSRNDYGLVHRVVKLERQTISIAAYGDIIGGKLSEYHKGDNNNDN